MGRNHAVNSTAQQRSYWVPCSPRSSAPPSREPARRLAATVRMDRPAPIVAVCLLALAASWFLRIADAGAQTREKHEVLASGHPITVWSKRPEPSIRGVLVLVHGRR